jgi:hypothetical protein
MNKDIQNGLRRDIWFDKCEYKYMLNMLYWLIIGEVKLFTNLRIICLDLDFND